MKIWLQKFLILVSAGVVYLAGQYFRGVWTEQFPALCLYKESPQGAYCNWPYFETLGLPLIAAGEVLAIAGAILLFANREGLRMWLKMSAVYIPLAALALIFNPAPVSGGFYSIGIEPEHLVWLLGYPYLLFTFGIVVGTRYRAFFVKK